LLRSNAVSIHLVLSPRSRGLIGPNIAMMTPGAVLIHTSRAPIVRNLARTSAKQNFGERWRHWTRCDGERN
jgi:phosphoglycerate dehydrogenase-like enzyme